MTILIGDIGGTKTILALINRESDPRAFQAERRFESREFGGLREIIQAYLDTNKERLAGSPLIAAAFGVAGPVVGKVVRTTNLPWTVSRADLAQVLDLPEPAVALLNDLQALATAVPHLAAEDIHTLNEGRPIPHSPIAVLAPGTGLGEAFLTSDGQRYRAFPSEGGHTDFGPGDQLQLEMLNYLDQRFDHVSTERVCSGMGIPNIYAFLRDENKAEEPDWLREALAAAEDPVPIIINNALDDVNSSPICRLTLETFLAILGAEAGNMVLSLLARSGVYLGGGIPPRILPAFEGPHFMRAYLDKGRFSQLMADTPVHIILYPKAALLGTAYAALELSET